MADDKQKPFLLESQDEAPPELPKVRSLLADILESTKADSEAETEMLAASLRSRQDAERKALEDAERKKAEEARRRVDEERLRLEETRRQFEIRKAQKEAEALAAANPQPAPVSVIQPKKKSKAPIFVAVGIVLVAGAGVIGWQMMPQGEPVSFAATQSLQTARPGALSTTAVSFGSQTVTADGTAYPADRIVASIVPRTYKVPPPEPKVRVSTGPTKPRGPQIQIRTGIFGGPGGTIRR